MPLPLGTWKVNVDGQEGTLTIQSSDPLRILLDILGKNAINGFWNEISQTITFGFSQGEFEENRVSGLFKGHLVRTPPFPGPGQDIVATLTGSLDLIGSVSFLPTVTVTSRRNVFGWFAQITEVVE